MEPKRISLLLSVWGRLLASLNGVAFGLLVLLLGGAAFGGAVIDGMCFFGPEEGLQPVSCSLYHYSFWHGVSVLVGLSLAVIVAFWDYLLWRGEPAEVRRKAEVEVSSYWMIAITVLLFVGLIVFGLWLPRIG